MTSETKTPPAEAPKPTPTSVPVAPPPEAGAPPAPPSPTSAKPQAEPIPPKDAPEPVPTELPAGPAGSEEQMKEVEKLDPIGDERIWIVGKPPDKGGKEEEWERYFQRPLGYVAKFRFFGKLSAMIEESLESTGDSLDSILEEAGVLRGRKLSAADFRDAASIMPVVLRMVTKFPDYLLELNCILLDVPKGQRPWAMRNMERPYRPESDQWGLSDDDGIGIIETCVEQNWDALVDFFGPKNLGRIVTRVRAKLPEPKDEGQPSESVQ